MNHLLKPLSRLKAGDHAVIRELTKGDLALKLMEMGFLPGEKIVIARIAPLGDPISVKLGSYLLSLRKEEAKTIMVQLSASSA